MLSLKTERKWQLENNLCNLWFWLETKASASNSPCCNRRSCSVRLHWAARNCTGTSPARVGPMQCPPDSAVRLAEEGAGDRNRFSACSECTRSARPSSCWRRRYSRCRWWSSRDWRCCCCRSLGNNGRCTSAIDHCPRRRSTCNAHVRFKISPRRKRFDANLPGIIEALRVAARVVRFAAVVPGANFIAINFARIEAGNEILFACWARAARFARHGEAAPSALTFIR